MGSESAEGRGLAGPKVALRRLLIDAKWRAITLPAGVGKIFNGDSRRNICVKHDSISKPCLAACQSLFAGVVRNTRFGHFFLTETRFFDTIEGLCVH